MPEPRRIGAWVSGGKYLASGIDALVQHEFTAAQAWLTPPSQQKLNDIDDVFAVRAHTRHLALFVHAPYNTFLYPPLVKHGKQMAWLAALGRATDQVNAGLVLHFGHGEEYLDTDIQAALQMIDVIPPTVPIYIENAGGGTWTFKYFLRVIELLKRTRDNVWMCLDTAHAWMRGWEGLFREGDTRMIAALRPYVGLLHLNNTYVAFGSQESGDYFPIFSGNISEEQIAAILRGLPGVPVILERSLYMQAVIDRAAVIALDQNLTDTLEAMRKSPVTGAIPS